MTGKAHWEPLLRARAIENQVGANLNKRTDLPVTGLHRGRSTDRRAQSQARVIRAQSRGRSVVRLTTSVEFFNSNTHT